MRGPIQFAVALVVVGALTVGSVAAEADPAPPPTFDGFTAFPEIKGPSDPEEYSWEVRLGKGQSLVSIDSQTAEVVYEEDGTVAFTIEAERAHDGVGSTVPTSLAVSEGKIVTLTVHHREGNPAAEGAPFVYPVVAGPGFELGFETSRFYAPEETAAEERSEVVAPPGFGLRAGNGYRMSVAAFANPQAGVGRVLVDLRSRHADVTYSAPATVGSGSIEADLGRLGEIDVHFVPTGGSRTEKPRCGMPVQVDSGRYEGSIDFQGEHGYSEVHATAARAEARMALGIVCPSVAGPDGVGGHAPGARLTAKRKGGSGRFEFTAMENSPKRPVRLTAEIDERRGALAISRSVEIVAGRAAFDFDVPAGRASVQPPRPFAGRAIYRRRPHGRSAWHGDLRVDFPGRPHVRLTGRGTRAGLIRAVLNPGHPF